MLKRLVKTTVIFLLSVATAVATSQRSGVGRSFGYVPDAAAAIRIAVIVWEPIYGKKEIASERPFHAELRRGIWYVHGSLPSGFLGGVAEAKIRQSDGKVLHIFHGQ